MLSIVFSWDRLPIASLSILLLSVLQRDLPRTESDCLLYRFGTWWAHCASLTYPALPPSCFFRHCLVSFSLLLCNNTNAFLHVVLKIMMSLQSCTLPGLWFFFCASCQPWNYVLCYTRRIILWPSPLSISLRRPGGRENNVHLSMYSMLLLCSLSLTFSQLCWARCAMPRLACGAIVTCTLACLLRSVFLWDKYFHFCLRLCVRICFLLVSLQLLLFVHCWLLIFPTSWCNVHVSTSCIPCFPFLHLMIF